MIRFALAFLTLTSLAACETIQGAGQDIENTGEAISSEARQTQAQM